MIRQWIAKGKIFFILGVLFLGIAACRSAVAPKEQELTVKQEMQKPEENPEQQEIKEEAESEEKQPEQESEAAPVSEQPEQTKSISRQSALMLEYTKEPWSLELEEALKDLDFSQFHFDVNQPKQIGDINSLFVLANKANYFPENFEPIELVDPRVKHAGNVTRRQLRKIAAEALEALLAEAEQAGHDIQSVSGYRTIAYQKILYQYNVERQGVVLANRYSSKPGHSEHHTGLCMDVSSKSVGFDLIEAYGEKKEGKWLAENAHRYGFIIRYPKGKEDWTGYSYEPWHLRYLGIPLAEYLYKTGLCYEEFLGLQLGKMPEEIRIVWAQPENGQNNSIPVPEAVQKSPIENTLPNENTHPAEDKISPENTEAEQVAPAVPLENLESVESEIPLSTEGSDLRENQSDISDKNSVPIEINELGEKQPAAPAEETEQ